METSVSNLGLTYETILAAYESFFSEAIIGEIILGVKFLAIALFALSIGTNFISKIGNKWGFGELDLPFDGNKLIISLIYVLVIAFYDKLLGVLDHIFTPLDTYFANYDSLSIVELSNEHLEQELNQGPWYVLLKEYAAMMMNIFTGGGDNILLSIATGIAYIIDKLIYIVFLVERFFFLGLLKILGPFAILMSIYRAKGDMFDKWLKLYISVYLLIIPFYLVIGFAGELIKTINRSLAEQIITDLVFGRAILTVGILAIIWIKLRLFKKSYDMVYRLMV